MNEPSITPAMQSPIEAAGSDRACLVAWRRRFKAECLRPLIDRYLAFVFASALRQTASLEHSTEVTKAVFLVLARRARRLRKSTVMAGWLFEVTRISCRSILLRSGWRERWSLFGRKRKSPPPADMPLWTQVASELDPALRRLSSGQRNALLLRLVLNMDPAWAAAMLRISESRVEKRTQRGLSKLARRLRGRGVVVESDTLAQACMAEGCAVPVPEGLADEILASIDEHPGKRPSLKLARRILSNMAWSRWIRRVAIGVPSAILMLVAMIAGLAYLSSLSGHSRLLSMLWVWGSMHEGKSVPGLAQPARPWPVEATSPRLDAAQVHSAGDIYHITNIWLAHLKFSRAQWDAVQPKRIAPLSHFMQKDGSVLLRNPNAMRNGLAGVLGFNFEWGRADLDFGGLTFTNVGARIKGNGTFLGSLYGQKRAFKVDLNKFVKGQKLAGVDELTFNNLVIDYSCMCDALGYELYRDAGVPAPRTAYAYLSISVEDGWNHKPLGLYAMIEAIDEDFAASRFGSKKAPLFKPVTYELFKDLGENWAAYEGIYDLKTQATTAQQRRVIEFSKLVTHAADAEFAARLGEFLDLEEFARFLACEVLLSNYDGILSNGQNFYLYLDPTSNKFGFIPWDLDFSWGGFFLLGSKEDRERASIRHPWVAQNRFLERVMAVEAFSTLYRRQVEELVARLFVPERLSRRIDAMASTLRSPIAAESDFRLNKFEGAVSTTKLQDSGEQQHGADRVPHQLKHFIAARVLSVRQQIDGKSDGVIVHR